jgi:hypothetical protein
MTTLNLEVNDAGGWRRVMSFDQDHLLTVCDFASAMLCLSLNEKLRARIITAASTAPLLTWTNEHGWQQWRSAA